MWKRETLRRVQLGVLIAVVAVFIIYVLNKFLLYNQFDNSYPEISFGKELLEVSVTTTEEELLADVTAKDKKDGDVTDSLMIEGMSNLLEGNERIVTYVAFDEDNHVSKVERRIKYTDYRPIRFSLHEPLSSISMSSSFSAAIGALKATDCVDGDISDNIVIADTVMENLSTEALYVTYKIQVTNSCGEIAELELPIKMNMGTSNSVGNLGAIALKEYLIYANVGDEIHYKDYITSATWRGNEVGAERVNVESNVDTTIPGTYVATYTFTQDEVRITCDLIIVVEE